jgi:hypothetical protein
LLPFLVSHPTAILLRSVMSRYSGCHCKFVGELKPCCF